MQYQLWPLSPVADRQDPRPRLNVLVNTLSKQKAYGGVATNIYISLKLFEALNAITPWRIRFLCFGPAEGENLGVDIAHREGVDISHATYEYISALANSITVSANDVFIGSLWHNYYKMRPVLEFLAKERAAESTPYIYLIQDYEPSFHPWSSAHVLAQSTYDDKFPKIGVFNSEELMTFFQGQKHRFQDQFYFEPILNRQLAIHLPHVTPEMKQKRIIVYARPQMRRNCFFLVKQALQLWSETFENSAAWDVVSAGADHDAFRLATGQEVKSQGKLSLDQYGRFLSTSAVGLSVMASPHPSYPPLEMAHFGVLTVTNSFASKNLNNWHDNILSVDVSRPDDLAFALGEQCEEFERDRRTGFNRQSKKPGYISGAPMEFINPLAQLLHDKVV
ncbi:MAG: hypothetical protein R3C51_14535 [Parvularculaceae bacterium]